MPAPFMLKAVLHWKGFGEEGTIGWHLGGATSVPSPAALTAAAGNIVHRWEIDRTPSSKTAFCSLLVASQSVDLVTLYSYAVSNSGTAGKPAKATALGQFAPVGWVGTSASVGGPLQESMVATLRTAQAGKSFRGRQYFPGHCIQLSSSTMLAGNTDATKVQLLAVNMGPEAAAGAAQSIGIGTCTWGVYSPTLDVLTPITVVSVDNKMDVQRRRAKSLKATFTA